MAMVRMVRSAGSSGFVLLDCTYRGEPIPPEARGPQPSTGDLRILLPCCGPGTHDSHAVRDGGALPAHAQPSFDLHYAVPAGRRHPGRIYLASPGVAVDCVVPAALRSDVLRSMPTLSCDSTH